MWYTTSKVQMEKLRPKDIEKLTQEHEADK